MVPTQIVAALELARGTRTVLDDGDVGLVIQYIGAEQTAGVASKGNIEVTAAGDLLLQHDQSGALAPDTSIKLPTGGTDGMIDVSDAAANTFGQVADHLNASPNWRCFIADALRADSSDDALLLLAATDVAVNETITLKKDTTAALTLAVSLSKEGLGDFEKLGDQSTHARIYEVTWQSTYAAGTSSLEIHAVVTDKYGVVISEELLFTIISAATATEKTKTFTAGLKPNDRDVGYRLLARVVNDTAMSAAKLTVDGAVINALEVS